MTMEDVKKARALITDLHRLSENGDGAVQWGFECDFELSEVLRAGFFQAAGKQGLRKNDRIFAVCRQHETIVTHATLDVTVARPGSLLEVVQLGESFDVEIGSMTPHERLGVPVSKWAIAPGHPLLRMRGLQERAEE